MMNRYVVATNLQYCDAMLNSSFKMEIVFNPMILYHFDNWQVFEDDVHVIIVLDNLGVFLLPINWQEE